MGKRERVPLAAAVLLFTAACGGTPMEKIKEVQDVYASSVGRHNGMVEAYADVEGDSLSEELNGMAERLKAIGSQDAQEMTVKELDAVMAELEAMNARYGEMRIFLEEAETGTEEGEEWYAIPVTIVNNTGVQLFQLYLYQDSDGDKGSNLAGDIGYLDGYQTRSILNLYMGEDERLWHLEAIDEEGNVIESAEVDFTGYGEDGVTVRMEYSFDAMEGWIEME